MKKLLALTIAVLVVPLLVHGSVVAQIVIPGPQVPFPPPLHTQDLTETYVYSDPSLYPCMTGGPAMVYGQNITVQYVADRRTFRQLPSGQAMLNVKGSATIYAGGDTTGEILDVRPFKNVLVTSEWPFSWYGCLTHLRYRFVISDVYEVTAEAEDGAWTFWYGVYTDPPLAIAWITSGDYCVAAP